MAALELLGTAIGSMTSVFTANKLANYHIGCRQLDEWSREARKWSESNGVIKGDENGNKQYKSFCTREQKVIFLKRAMEG